jgi:hypothetical protein
MSLSNTAMLALSPGALHQFGQMRPRPCADELRCAFAQPNQFGPQGIAAVLELPHIAHHQQRPDETVNGWLGQLGASSQLPQRHTAARARHDLQQLECALNRLHTGFGRRLVRQRNPPTSIKPAAPMSDNLIPYDEII